MSYADFLATKSRGTAPVGVDATAADVNDWLHGWQREIVAWAAVKGRAAIWADTGLGKTAMQLEWLRLSSGAGIGLVVAPLADLLKERP